MWRKIEAATAEAEELRLARDGEFALAVDHFFPPNNPALPKALRKKSFSNVCSSLIAANATFALKAGLWFRRSHLVLVSMPKSGRNSAYSSDTDFSSRLYPPAHQFVLLGQAPEFSG